jgi:2-phosphoglycerate kinase
MNKIILIGGSPTVGKSYTARKLAEELKLPWISTDTIRDQMRAIVRKEDYPSLFAHKEAGANVAVDFLTNNTAEEIVRHQNEESLDAWKGILGLINSDYVWGDFIVEGIAILPELVSKIKTDKEIKAVFLIDEDRDRVRNTIFTRGLWDDADKYPDDVKEKEVEWVFAFNKFIKEEADKYNFPVVSVGDRGNYIEEIKKLIQ